MLTTPSGRNTARQFASLAVAGSNQPSSHIHHVNASRHNARSIDRPLGEAGTRSRAWTEPCAPTSNTFTSLQARGERRRPRKSGRGKTNGFADKLKAKFCDCAISRKAVQPKLPLKRRTALGARRPLGSRKSRDGRNGPGGAYLE